jgi:transposase-like protein
MPLPVKACPYCSKLMWVRDESVEWIDENTVRFRCPHCQSLVRRNLVEQGANAAGPIKPS